MTAARWKRIRSCRAETKAAEWRHTMTRATEIIPTGILTESCGSRQLDYQNRPCIERAIFPREMRKRIPLPPSLSLFLSLFPSLPQSDFNRSPHDGIRTLRWFTSSIRGKLLDGIISSIRVKRGTIDKFFVNSQVGSGQELGNVLGGPTWLAFDTAFRKCYFSVLYSSACWIDLYRGNTARYCGAGWCNLFKYLIVIL